MKDCINIVIVGAGLVGKRHIDAAHKVDAIRIIAIVDPNKAVKDYAQAQNIRHYSDLDTLFQNETPDGVILSTPTNLHVQQAITCLDHNCPILLEKPIAATAHSAIDLVELGEKKQIPILVGHHRRHNPIIQAARQAIIDGVIGDIRSLAATCWFYKPDHYFEIAPWRTKKGAGPISVNLVHDVDLIRYICGEVISVDARSTPSRRGFENEDVAAAILTFKNGAIGTVSVADAVVSPWSWELTSGEYPIYTKTDQNCYLIGGSQGALSVPDLKLWSHEATPDWWTPIHTTNLPCTPNDPLVKQMLHFMDVINGKADPIISGREGLRTLQVVEAIQNSANQKKTIFIDDTEDTITSSKSVA